MRVPDYADPTPAYQQIATDLRARIKAAEYELGGRLPSNKALVKMYGVSEGTIRAALDELRSEGVVATQSTRGTYVIDKPGESEDFATVMKTLDGLREELTQLRARVEDLERRQ